MVNFTINSIDVPRRLTTAEYSEAVTSTHRERCAPGVIATTDWSHVAQVGTQSTRLQAKAVWGPRVH